MADSMVSLPNIRFIVRTKFKNFICYEQPALIFVMGDDFAGNKCMHLQYYIEK
jgi:hypothetical protein